MKEEIIKMAREAGFVVDVSTDPNSPPSWWGCAHNDTFERFFHMAQAAEREACERELQGYDLWGPMAAKVIRARGQA